MNTSITKASDDERLSALADNALSADEVRQILSRLSAAPRGTQHNAARRLERYAMLGELMRAEADSSLFAEMAQRRASRDLAGVVMQQIATETAQLQSARPVAVKSSLWGGWLAAWRAPAFSMALAASVAGVMLVVVQDAGVNPGESMVSAESAAPLLSAQRSALPDLTETAASSAPPLAELEAAADTLPDAYLLQHLTHAEGGPVRNLSSNVRLASYERP
jgi:negative regulator of sigma E activity